MTYNVIVRFAEDREYEIEVEAGAAQTLDADAARSWLAQQMEALECDYPNKMGKVLVADLALALAQCAGEPLFAEGGEWAHSYAQVLARLFDRPVILVDVANHRIG